MGLELILYLAVFAVVALIILNFRKLFPKKKKEEPKRKFDTFTSGGSSIPFPIKSEPFVKSPQTKEESYYSGYPDELVKAIEKNNRKLKELGIE